MKALSDCYPQYGFQTGVTPDLQEQARDHSQYVKDNLQQPNLPATKQVARDNKWRYFWGMGKDNNTNNNNENSNENVL